MKIVEYVGEIDWEIVVRRFIWSVPLAVLVVIACVIVFIMSERTGQKKIDYVYASEEEKESIREHHRILRKRVLVCVFWITIVLVYALQYVADSIVLMGGA